METWPPSKPAVEIQNGGPCCWERSSVGEELGYLRFPIHQAPFRPLFELSAQVEQGRDIGINRAVEIAGRTRGERSRPRIGLDSLTPTELRVAQLVRGGLSNSQIAAEMVVSRHSSTG